MEDFNRESFSDKIRTRRIEMGFRSQKDFADAAGISVQAVNYYESGKRLPDAETIYKIAECLNCSVDWLFDRSINACPDNAAIGRDLGLCDEAISALQEYHKRVSNAGSDNFILNWIISEGFLFNLVLHINNEISALIQVSEGYHDLLQRISNVPASSIVKVSLEQQIEFSTFRLSRNVVKLFELIVANLLENCRDVIADSKEEYLEKFRDYKKSSAEDAVDGVLWS